MSRPTQENVEDNLLTWKMALQELHLEINRLDGEKRHLEFLLNNPEINSFQRGVRLEAAHQRQRWGGPHDREKSPEHWFWLVGYLAGKALRSAMEDDQDKARHHCISTAAALFHWHTAITGRHLLDQDLAAHDEPPEAPSCRS